MRVLFTSTQGEGHVRPLIPYARALAELGNEVAVATPEDGAAILQRAGVAHFPFARMTEEEFGAIWAPHWSKNVQRDEMLRIALPEMFAGPTARRALPELSETIERWRPDVIVREAMEFAGFVLAEARGIPHVRINVHNCDVEARAIDFAIDAVDMLRTEVRCVPDKGAALLTEPAFTSFPAGFDGDARHEPNNPPFRVWSRADGPPPEVDWRPKGSRPLAYVTFGTMVSARVGRESIFRVALDAAADLDIEVLMTTGKGFDISSLGPIPSNVIVRNFVSQAAVFPHATAMLNHGGSGTLLGGFAAGLPQVIAPHSADQPYNADRTQAGGFGLQANPSSSEEMRSALQSVITNPTFTTSARRLAAEMLALPNHMQAAERIMAIT